MWLPQDGLQRQAPPPATSLLRRQARLSAPDKGFGSGTQEPESSTWTGEIVGSVRFASPHGRQVPTRSRYVLTLS